MGGRGDATRAAEAGRLYASGKTVRQVAAELGVVPSRAWRLIKRAGVPLRHSYGCPRRTADEPIVKAAVGLYADGLSLRQVARELNVGSAATIRRYLARAAESAAG